MIFGLILLLLVRLNTCIMRKFFIPVIAFIIATVPGSIFAQVATLNQNFDATCASQPGPPPNWFKYNPPSTTWAGGLGQWECDPTLGRKNGAGTPTPGMKCTGIWSTAFHLDTSFLGTPLLSFSSYGPNDHLFLLFDTKTDIFTGGKFSVIVAPNFDTTFTSVIDSEITAAASPVFGPGDASDWVTHKINMDRYKTFGPFYIGFRYTSTNSSGSVWYIDNVNIVVERVGVNDISAINNSPIKIIGQSTSSNIRLSFDESLNGQYEVTLYDVMGRSVYSRHMEIKEPGNVYALTDLNLSAGLYIIKMASEKQFLSAKVVIE